MSGDFFIACARRLLHLAVVSANFVAPPRTAITTSPFLRAASVEVTPGVKSRDDDVDVAQQ